MPALREGSEATTVPASSPSSASTMSESRPPPPEHQRHWPLDLPSGLPFDRYEHRRLTARDILVHRIMSKALFPTPDLSRALNDRRKQDSTLKSTHHCCDYHRRESQTKAIPHHNFGPIKQHDRCLARDVELLRKMLVTRSDAEFVSQPHLNSARFARSAQRVTYNPSQAPRRGPRRFIIPYIDPPDSSVVPTVEEEVLDLVRRHYMETDDACTRLWLRTMQPAQRSSYNTLPKHPAKCGSRRNVVRARRLWDERNAAEDYKRWYDEDTAHLKALQIQTSAAVHRRLYDGGALLPRLRRPLFSSKMARDKLIHSATEFSRRFFTDVFDGLRIVEETFPWPEPAAPRRLIHMPAWLSWQHKDDFFRYNDLPLSVPAFDLASGRVGRGLDRDGIWSTARWCGDDLPRGRIARRGRRRATSEPPHGLFAAAKLPATFNTHQDVLLFPKMSLAAIDRRARRRSLSRTRISEMFNWDAVLEAPPPGKTASRMEIVSSLALGQESSVERSFELDKSEVKKAWLEQEQSVSRYKDILRKYKSGLISLEAATEVAWASAPGSDPRLTRWPQWWLETERLVGDSVGDESPPRVSLDVLDQLLDWFTQAPPIFREQTRMPDRPVLCVNCTSHEHTTDGCGSPCGYCGAPNPNMKYDHVGERRFMGQFAGHNNSGDESQPSQAAKHHNPHLAPNCPVAKQNRCKCSPFPQFHIAAKCPALCSRDCGNHEHPPGHFRHKNAMSCKARCCMCGMKGHSGMKCKWRRCRCGGEHLGQDCDWHPECRARDCDRFLCGVHCQVCGVDRAELDEGVAIVGGRCPTCVVPLDAPASAGVVVVADDPSDLSSAEAIHSKLPDHGEAGNPLGQKRRRRKNKRKHRPEEPVSPPGGKPWYAPLEPRVRPVASGKSGKRGAWDRAKMGELPVRIGGCR